MTPAQRAAAALARLCGPAVATAAVPVGQGGPLWPDEAAAMTRAIPRRLAEFAAGRTAARAAMLRLGWPAAAIAVAPDRAPVWPNGLSGSLCHDAGMALAALRASAAPLGIDCEPDAPLDPALWSEIAFDGELEALAGWDPGRGARLVFAAKEAAYKAQYPLTRQVIGFDALRISVDGARLVARFARPVGGFARGAELRGGWAIQDGRLLVAIGG